MKNDSDIAYVAPDLRSIVVTGFETEAGKSTCNKEFFEIESFELWTNDLLATSNGSFPFVQVRNWCGTLLDIGVGDKYWFLFVRFQDYPYSGYVLKSPPGVEIGDDVLFCQVESVALDSLIPRANAISCVEEWYTRGCIEVVPRVLLTEKE